MSIQDILRTAGIMLMVIAALLAAAAAYIYRALDIRGVKDDLSGRRRSNSVSGSKARPPRRSAASMGGASIGEPGSRSDDASVSPPTSPPKRTVPIQPSPDEFTEVLGRANGQPAPETPVPEPSVEFRITRKVIFATNKTIEE